MSPNLLRTGWQRLQLSLAKHRSLAGHPRTALALARFLPAYSYDEAEAFGVDGAPAEVVERRRVAFHRLGRALAERAPRSIAASEALRGVVSDAAFVDAHRVPFPFQALVQAHLPVGTVAEAAEGARIRDLDGNWYYDLSGSYGVNLLGPEFYQRTMARAARAAGDLGVTLGPYHPGLVDTVARLRAVSGMDEVSFHMSGTEAVMQAVRLARYHTRRSHVVRFVGAYHGWWDGVQAGPGNPRPSREVYTLPELSERTLAVLRSRDDIACVLVNPIQVMHPNATPPTDSTLLVGGTSPRVDIDAYATWLRRLREVCDDRGIALVLDEVFLGFRLAPGGAQEFFGVRADLVTYGKTLGGGFPVGVVCGRARWMRRWRDDAPADVCFARGTFNAHPYVVAAMGEFLRSLDSAEVRATYEGLRPRWDGRAAALDAAYEAAGVPVRVANLVSVWAPHFTEPGRFHWMYQFYLRAHGLWPAWTGSGRFIFAHTVTDAEFAEIAARLVAAAEAMRDDGWWWAGASEAAPRFRRAMLTETARAFVGLPARPRAPALPPPPSDAAAARQPAG